VQRGLSQNGTTHSRQDEPPYLGMLQYGADPIGADRVGYGFQEGRKSAPRMPEAAP
jgi:hypothetical protein